MTGLRWIALLFVVLGFGLGSRAGDGRLADVRSEINEPEHGSSDDDGCESGRWRDDDDDDVSFFGQLIGPSVLFAVTSPWAVPMYVLKDDNSITASFPAAPYTDGNPGYLVPAGNAPELTRDWAGRLTLEVGSDFDNLGLAGGRLQLDSARRFGLDSSWTRLTEDVFGGQDELWIGDANLVYRFAQSEAAQFYTGLGVNWAADHGDGDLGFNFTYGADWFPARPWVLSAQLDLGTLGEASLFHTSATLGLLLDRFELFTGVDYLNLEGNSLPGAITGLRVWF